MTELIKTFFDHAGPGIAFAHLIGCMAVLAVGVPVMLGRAAWNEWVQI